MEPEFTTCDTSVGMFTGSGSAAAVTGSDGDFDLDGDGTTLHESEDEDGDGDEVYETIGEALSNTSSGGIVHLPARGVYREQVTISDAVTIRGGGANDIVLSDDCSASASTAITISAGADDLVVLENLTIRGYTTAIDISGSNASAIVVLRNCRFEDNTTAIKGKAGLDTRVMGCRLSGNGTAITDADDLLVVDSEVTGSTTASMTISVGGTWRISGSLIADNADGLFMDGSGTGTGILDVTTSRILRNGNGGIRLDNALAKVGIHDSVISANGGHGLKISAGEGSKFRVTDSLIDDNDDSGIYVLNQDSCTALTGEGVEGLVVSSRVLGNGDDGINIGGSSSGCNPPTTVPSVVRCGLLDSAISANAGYGIVARATGTLSFNCGLGLNPGLLTHA